MIKEKYYKQTRHDAEILSLRSIDGMQCIGNEAESQPKGNKYCIGLSLMDNSQNRKIS